MARLGPFESETRRADREKYAAQVVLLHGLWTGPDIWRGFAGYLSHRGWTSHALGLRGAGHAGWTELIAALHEVVLGFENPPFVIGHDLGALLALRLRPVAGAAALAPLPVGYEIWRHPIFRSARGRVCRWLNIPLRPSSRQARAFLGLPREHIAADRPGWPRDLAQLQPAFPTGQPCLLAAGDRDPCSPNLDALRAAAQTAGATFITFRDIGHALPLEPGWEAVVTNVHRWMIRQGGDSILLLHGDEDLRGE